MSECSVGTGARWRLVNDRSMKACHSMSYRDPRCREAGKGIHTSLPSGVPRDSSGGRLEGKKWHHEYELPIHQTTGKRALAIPILQNSSKNLSDI